MDKDTFGSRVVKFNSSLYFRGDLPQGISIMNPFRENACATPASEKFYSMYYNDNNRRYAILGINPGRFGAGITGVPFTDPQRLAESCGIVLAECPNAREPSSVFVYEIIKAYGGVRKFYSKWYINSICPLGFTRRTDRGREVNYNYYDSADLQKAVTPFILKTLQQQIDCGLDTAICFCFGKGKNFAFMQKINREHKFFEKIVPLDHPRFIVQYKSAQISEKAQEYARKFLDAAG